MMFELPAPALVETVEPFAEAPVIHDAAEKIGYRIPKSRKSIRNPGKLCDSDDDNDHCCKDGNDSNDGIPCAGGKSARIRCICALCAVFPDFFPVST